MVVKLSLSQLLAQAEAGTLTAEAAGRYFLPDVSAGTPFEPAVRFNPRTVNVTALRGSASVLASALARDIGRSSAALRHAVPGPFFARKAVTSGEAIAAAEAGATILAEGDSWFDLPFIYPRTLVDFLGERHAVVTLAQWGDTLEGMIAAKQFVKPLRTKAFKHFLFSGGGNDIVGGGKLELFLRQFDVGHADPSDAPWYINDLFVDALDRVMGHYRALLKIVVRESPKTKLVIHGYDYVIPQQNGHWLGNAMTFRGLDPVHKAPLCKAVIKVMIDAFNSRLKQFADGSNGAVIYVDLRKSAHADEWFDELHARENATKRFAAAFEQAISS
ncbi:hypothetical protein [Bosea sp. (in: a-proteobacteria)]|uniref:hypothetical protein n=1 Tax=Bosea sp. (in: a-proteobacteria) TaxID=1871050 RepID=UPI004034B294